MQTQQPIDWDTNYSTPDALFADDDFCAQEKLDGKRCVIFCEGGNPHAVTRTGKPLKLPAKATALLPFGDYVIDGELATEDFTAFDVLSVGRDDVASLPYSERLELLASLKVPMITTVYGEKAKRALHLAVKRKSGEGIVFKRLSAKYRPGKTVDQYRLKNWRSDTFRVASVDGMGIELDYKGRPAGRCAGFANVGDLVEVRFQERTASGKLLHPVLLEIRDDIS